MKHVALVVVWLGLSLGALVDPAMAHGELIASSPFAGQTVGGDLTTIELVFSEEVQMVSVVLETDSGSTSVSARNASPNVILIDVEAPLVDGMHQLVFSYVSTDDDQSEGSLSFSYLESAPEAFSVVSSELTTPPKKSRWVWPYVVAFGFLAAGAVVVATRWLHLRKVERSSRVQDPGIPAQRKPRLPD